jgi:phenylpropionate dioxygenase-like ring-hydroxylating dioxygenase large terminal subunit
MEAGARTPISADQLDALTRPLLEAGTMPPEVYWSPEIYEREIQEIWFKEWICVGRAEDIPNPGDWFTRTLISEPIIVVRDGEGEIRAHLNVCRHRGCQIVGAGDSGEPEFDYGAPYPAPERGTAKSFRCPYHGWLFGLNGELRGTPDFKETRNFDKAEYGLASLKVELWNNFILVNLDPEATPFGDRVKDMAKWDLDLYDPASMVTVARWDRPVECNWKVFVENSVEFYHGPWVHPGLQEIAPMKGWVAFEDITEEPWMLLVGQFPGLSYTESGETLFPPRPGLVDARPEFDGLPIVYIFPSIALVITCDTLTWRMTVPTGPESCEFWYGFCIPPESAEALAAGDKDVSEKVHYAVQEVLGINNEDAGISVKQQRGVRARSATAGRYCKHEPLVWVFDKEVAKKAYGANGGGNGTAD